MRRWPTTRASPRSPRHPSPASAHHPPKPKEDGIGARDHSRPVRPRRLDAGPSAALHTRSARQPRGGAIQRAQHRLPSLEHHLPHAAVHLHDQGRLGDRLRRQEHEGGPAPRGVRCAEHLLPDQPVDAVAARHRSLDAAGLLHPASERHLHPAQLPAREQDRQRAMPETVAGTQQLRQRRLQRAHVHDAQRRPARLPGGQDRRA